MAKEEIHFSVLDADTNKVIWEPRGDCDHLHVCRGDTPVLKVYSERSESEFRAAKLSIFGNGIAVKVIRDGLEIASYVKGKKE